MHHILEGRKAPESIQEFLILIPPQWDGSSNSTHQAAAAFCYTNSLQPCPVESLNLSGSQLWPASPDLQWFVIEVSVKPTSTQSLCTILFVWYSCLYNLRPRELAAFPLPQLGLSWAGTLIPAPQAFFLETRV